MAPLTAPASSRACHAADCSCTATPFQLGRRAFLAQQRSGHHASFQHQRSGSAVAAAMSDAPQNGVPPVRRLVDVPDAPGSTAVEGQTVSSVGPVDQFINEFCIIENRESVKDFESLDLAEIKQNVEFRRNRIFLLMEEVRRLKIQQRLKGDDMPLEELETEEKYVSALPFLPALTDKTLKDYYTFYASFCASVIIFGGILAPILEVKLGVGGTSYAEFITSVHLPSQLAEVDPIVASFCGGAVGVLSALLVVEVNNVKKQQRNRCHYCEGSGYLMCGHCVGTGVDPTSGAAVAAGGPAAAAAVPTGCSYCAQTGKVMCTGCLCTGKQLATEFDRRRDPFD